MASDLERMAMQIDCAALVSRLYLMLDEHNYEALGEIFAEDAQWVRLGQRTHGLAAIRALLAQRSPMLATRHVISNAIVTADGPDRATGSFYMTVVRQHGIGKEAPRPIFVSGPWRLSVLSLRFAKTPAGWRIAEQTTATQFEFGEAPMAALETSA